MSKAESLEKFTKENETINVLSRKREFSVEKKTISIPKTDTESIELLSSILEKCNAYELGRKVTVTDILLFAIRKLKDADFEMIKESTLTSEEKTQKFLLEYNNKNGTNLTIFELAMKQLKKERKDTLQ
jgi:hypothetical protein